MSAGRVDQCVCFATSFQEWLQLKRTHGWTMAEAAANTGCGEGCGTCKPYLRVVACTGRTVLPVMSYADMLAYEPEDG